MEEMPAEKQESKPPHQKDAATQEEVNRKKSGSDRKDEETE